MKGSDDVVSHPTDAKFSDEFADLTGRGQRGRPSGERVRDGGVSLE